MEIENIQSLLGDVSQAIVDLKEIEPAYREAQQRVYAQVTQLGYLTSENTDLQKQTIAYLHWFVGDVPLDIIGKAFNIEVKQIRRIACEQYPDIQCSHCKDRLINPSNKNYPVRSLICTSCDRILRTATSGQEIAIRLSKAHISKNLRVEKSQQVEREQEAGVRYKLQAEEARAAKTIELRALPYREYLLTPEWQKKRASTLRRASGRCQVCNTNKATLDVHHRTYERIGDEHYTDLIVLCRKCHGTFHETSKLARG